MVLCSELLMRKHSFPSEALPALSNFDTVAEVGQIFTQGAISQSDDSVDKNHRAAFHKIQHIVTVRSILVEHTSKNSLQAQISDRIGSDRKTHSTICGYWRYIIPTKSYRVTAL